MMTNDTIAETVRNDERTRFALAGARVGIWETDLASGAVDWSESMSVPMGRSRAEFGGTSAAFLALVHPDDRDTITASLRDCCVAGKNDFEVDVRIAWADGTMHWIQSRGRVIRNDRGEAVRLLGVAQDITDRKQLEAQFLQAHKMEALGRVTGGVAHDFNNILTAILGFAMLIEEDPGDVASVRDHVQQIRKAGDRATVLARQLLAFSRRQVLRRQPVQLSNIATECVPMLGRVVGEQVTIALALEDAQYPIFGDPCQIEQVILNLAINARDAMPMGGRLTLRTRNVELADSQNAELDMTPGSYATLEVSDTGTGMDAATRARIFEPFFTTKPSGIGTGLGLSTVYGIVKQMGGGITVDSEPGKGTTLRLFFPKTARTLAEDHAPTEPRRATRGGGETVLLVEDEEPVRALLSAVLERNGYRVLQAAAADEACDVAANAGHPVNLVLSDVMMPGGNGLEMMRSLKHADIQPPAIYMSGYSGASLTRQGNLEKESPFLQKPFTNQELLTKIRDVLDLVHQPAKPPSAPPVPDSLLADRLAFNAR